MENGDGHKTDEHGFRKVDGDFIFIACSGDVADERHDAEEAVREALSRLGKTGDVRPLSWDLERGAEGTDQRRTMQRDIPRPSASNCLGIIYILGERIGLPLENGFNIDVIGDVERWTEKEGHRLVPDWPEDANEEMVLLEAGAFPLTGGVFEFLDARGHRSDEYPNGKPVWMGVMASEPVPKDEQIALNENRWFSRKTAGMPPAKRTQWENEEYKPQFMGVHNFMRAVSAHGIDQKPTPDRESLKEAIRQFVLEGIFDVKGRVATNPYRELMHYEAYDADQFHGRKGEARDAVVRFEERFDSTNAPTIRIEGPSGVGKSSFLRAGVIAELKNASRRGRYRIVALRPESFKNTVGGDRDVIRVVMEEIERQAELAFSVGARSRVDSAGAEQANVAAEVVMKSLAYHPGIRLVLALDQFEEIVDALNGTRADYWQPLLRFVEALTENGRHEQEPRFGLIYTLETSRKAAHDRIDLPPPFQAPTTVDLAAERRFLETVIRTPFRQSGYRLAEDVETHILKELEEVHDREAEAARNSVLPLLALQLHKLWDFVAANFLPGETDGVASVFADPSNSITIADLKTRGAPLSTSDIIAKQAKMAWRRAEVGAVDEEELRHFLEPFVGIQGGDVQLTATLRDAPYAAERKLVASFRERRLLVDAGDGLVRLVHEAVLRYWPSAKAWLENDREYLVMEARLRTNAVEWEQAGRPKVSTRSKKGKVLIAEVAMVLETYMRAWSTSEAQAAPSDTILRAYCLAVFQTSGTPNEPIPWAKGPWNNHVRLAATYGLMDMLRRFAKLDPASFHKPVLRRNGTEELPIFTAAWEHLDTVKFFLDQDVNPCEKTSDGWPVMTPAIIRGRRDILTVLMEAAQKGVGKPALERTLGCPEGWTLVHLAAQHDELDSLRILVEDYDFSVRTEFPDNMWRPLHVACANDAVEAFEYLRNHDDFRARCSKDATCLHFAAGNGAERVLDRLLALRSSAEWEGLIDSSGDTALHDAARGHHAGCVTSLLRNGFDPNASNGQGVSPLHVALISGGMQGDEADEERVRATLLVLLADPRTELNQKVGQHDARPLALANNADLQRLLLTDERTNLSLPIHNDGETGFFLALRLGVWDTVRHYVDAHGLTGGETDPKGNTALHHLTARNTPSDLLDNHIGTATAEQLNALNDDGETPLSRSLKRKSWTLAGRMLDVPGILLQDGDDWLGWKVWLALKNGAPDALLIRLLRAAPAIGEQVDAHGWTLLHHLCALGLKEPVEKLAEHTDLTAVWGLPDRKGRRPIDLMPNALRDLAPSDFEAQPWHEGTPWDACVKWRKMPKQKSATFLKLAERERQKDLELSEGILPFYDGARIVRLSPRPNGRIHPTRYWIDKEGDLYRLNGTSPPIHELNAKLPLRIDASNVADYLKFFCFFVRGEEGPFFIFDHLNLADMSEDVTEEDAKLIADHVRPSWLIGEREKGFDIAAPVYYSDALFAAYFYVQRSGMIEMKDDFPLVVDLPGRIHRPIQGN